MCMNKSLGFRTHRWSFSNTHIEVDYEVDSKTITMYVFHWLSCAVLSVHSMNDIHLILALSSHVCSFLEIICGSSKCTLFGFSLNATIE